MSRLARIAVAMLFLFACATTLRRHGCVPLSASH